MCVTHVTFVMYTTYVMLVMCVTHVTFLMCATYVTLVMSVSHVSFVMYVTLVMCVTQVLRATCTNAATQPHKHQVIYFIVSFCRWI